MTSGLACVEISAAGQVTVDAAAMSNANHAHETLLAVDRVDDAVRSDPRTPQSRTAAQAHHTGMPRILGQTEELALHALPSNLV